MKNIIIDCRYLSLSGIGRFLENLLVNLNVEKYKYTLLGKKELVEKYNLDYIVDNSNPYSLKGILFCNKLINKFDIYFTPNFIIPFGVKIKSYVTLHDLILLDVKESNNNYFEYLFKYYLIKRGVKRSVNIYTVSNFSKERIIKYFYKYKDKVKYRYQGISNDFKKHKETIKKDYVLYVGNIKTHKGLKTLILAYDYIINYELIIVGEEEKLINKDKDVLELIKNKKIKFTGHIDDNSLIEYIRNASFVVVPSLYEGFGLVPLESLYLNTKPIISDIEVFKEIYKEFDVIYFKKNDYIDLAYKINYSNSELKVDKLLLDSKFSSKEYMKMIEDDFNE
jgi:glycosyltransferase involved in cell wall biosynthesis